jgi:nitrogen fixation protein FixH
MKTKPVKAPGTGRNPWLLALLGMFIVVLSVNVTFVTLSTETNPGLVTNEYEKYGLQENRMAVLHRKQVARGWQLDLGLPAKWTVAQATPVTLAVTDHKGIPLGGARAEIKCFRPSDATKDSTFEFIEQKTPGQYKTNIKLDEPGVWDLDLLLEKNGEKHILTQRVTVDIASQHRHKRSFLDKIVRFLTPTKT